ncbi:DNA replication licensing factor MCM6 [Enterocytozoon bieneusi H348]|nr:DNA replication licensing factor MCM6 [Enterocytozoon bieneusi H348]|eukprot:XP_002649375.1 DNA replication licensing factor MCM6 [Enterocytozoon bieneusi H348]
MSLMDTFYSYLSSKQKIIDDIESILLQNGETYYCNLDEINMFNKDLFIEIQQNYGNIHEDLQKIFNVFCTTKFDKTIDLSFINNSVRVKIREIRSELLGRLISFNGTVTRTSQVRPELIIGGFKCRNCQTFINGIPQYFGYCPPLYCPNNLCTNRTNFDLIVEQSEFTNWQKIYIQESTEEIPKGSLPRNIEVIVRNELCEQINPGHHILFTGYPIVVNDDINKKMPNSILISELQGENNSNEIMRKQKSSIKKEISYKLMFVGISYLIEGLQIKQNKINMNIFNVPDLYNKLSESLFPTIYGHQNIKNAILLMLIGGCSKTNDIKLRGDINILLIGDPGTAKSQFLKQTASLLPRCVYTSGKSSSAAGLTAAVIRDENGEFTIDAGALMLSDRGICCIDEFDKMNYKDQVSIHEAMEQQTITIAKAGINATLNARCSILAAANPLKGRYDQSKTLKANVNLSAPIMSRFDLYFVLIDKIDKYEDREISKYILNIHSNYNSSSDCIDNHFLFTIDECVEFIKIAKKNKPILTEDAKIELENKYVKLRQESLLNTNNYKMTVRHLESMIRLSEALAKLHNTDVTVQHVNEAYRLLKSSLIEIKNMDIIIKNNIDRSEDQLKITTKEYKKAINIIVYILKNHNDINKEELIIHYLHIIEDEIESRIELEQEKIKIEKIIEFLIENEGILYITEDKFISIHPNYDI